MCISLGQNIKKTGKIRGKQERKCIHNSMFPEAILHTKHKWLSYKSVSHGNAWALPGGMILTYMHVCRLVSLKQMLSLIISHLFQSQGIGVPGVPHMPFITAGVPVSI